MFCDCCQLPLLAGLPAACTSSTSATRGTRGGAGVCEMLLLTAILGWRAQLHTALFTVHAHRRAMRASPCCSSRSTCVPPAHNASSHSGCMHPTLTNHTGHSAWALSMRQTSLSNPQIPHAPTPRKLKPHTSYHMRSVDFVRLPVPGAVPCEDTGKYRGRDLMWHCTITLSGGHLNDSTPLPMCSLEVCGLKI